MELFRRHKTISIDLKGNKLKECVHYLERDKAQLQDFCLKEIFDSNHLQITKTHGKSYERGIHDFIYDEEKKQITIKSRYEKSAFLIYLYLLMPVIALIGAVENQLKIVCIGIAMFIFITLMLFWGIKSQSKEIEFGFMQQVNYFKRNNRLIAKK
jgi:hypothetical protein